jgi:PST family polysaccharide transporter
VTGALGRRVGAGALWSAANAGALRFINFSVNILLARLVAPKEFGAFAVAMTIYTIVGSLNDVGVSSAIVREPERTKEIAPTVFSITLVMSTLLTAFMALAAPGLAGAFHSTEATGAVRVLSLTILLSSVVAVPNALLSRDYMQRQQLIADAAFLVVSTAVLLVFVRAGHPLMGLAFSRVAGQLVGVIIRVRCAPERYWPKFNGREARHLLSFGMPLVMSNAVILATANIDTFVITRVHGETMLGLYNLAFNISGWPLNIFSAILMSVTLPTLSRVRDDPEQLRVHLRAGLAAVSAAAFPVFALFAAVPRPLISTIYGPRWAPAATALVVLGLFGASQVVLVLFSDLIITLGMTRRLLAIRLAWMVSLAPTMYFCVHRWGIAGAGVAHALVVLLVVTPLFLFTVHRHGRVGIAWIGESLARPAIAAAAGGLCAFGVASLLDSSALRLIVGVATGLTVYVVVGGRWLRTLVVELRAMYWTRTPEELAAKQSGDAESATSDDRSPAPDEGVPAQDKALALE